MPKINPKVSIILVHYKESGVLYDCIRSIYKSSPKTSFEIVVVDNDEIKTVGKYLKKNFPRVKYVPASENLGYGKGNNLGIKNAAGEYVFILNPDTLVEKGTVDNLLKFLEKNKKVGVVAPTLYDKNGRMYPKQGTKKLTPLRGAIALSFLNKLFPRNPISKEYWLSDVNRTKPFEVEVVPGTAFMIKKSLFEKIGGFDKNFFLYFEESDFCKRVYEKNYKLFILPEARITHFWAVSTPPSDKIRKIFAQSRFYYFKKNFGILNALIVEFFVRLNKQKMLLIAILALGTFLRFYRIQANLIFNGEMGTDYMNVLGIIHGTRTFLIGPRTSHEWFFIPPIAYWIYTALLFFGNFNPAVINVFWAFVGSATIPICYYYMKKLFDERMALISSFLISVSPAWIDATRASRYNAPAAILFFPYLYYLFASIRDKGRSLFKLGLILGLTMSFFPSPLLLVPATIVCFIFYTTAPKIKYIFYGILGFLTPNVTYVIYEIGNKFQITIQLLTWIPYRIIGFFGLYHKNTVNTSILSQNFYSIYQFFSESIAGKPGIISGVIFVLIIVASLILFIKSFRKINLELPYILVFINLLVGYIGLFIHGNPPEHYYYVIYPIPLILAAYILAKIFKNKIVLIFGTLIVGSFGIWFLISSNWFYQDKILPEYKETTPPYPVIVNVVHEILSDSKGASFSVSRIGFYDQFENNFADNYIYLLTIQGAKVTDNAKLRYTIVEETDMGVVPEGKEIWTGGGIEIFKS